MAEPAKLLYASYILNVDKDYWLSLTGGKYPFESYPPEFYAAVAKVHNLFPLPPQLSPNNYSAYEKALDKGIKQWLNNLDYKQGEFRLYTEPKNTEPDKKYYVRAMILGL